MLCRRTLRRNDIRYLYTINFISLYFHTSNWNEKLRIPITNFSYLVRTVIRKTIENCNNLALNKIVPQNLNLCHDFHLDRCIRFAGNVREAVEILGWFYPAYPEDLFEIFLPSSGTGFPRSVDSIGKSSGWGSAGSRARDLDKDEA